MNPRRPSLSLIISLLAVALLASTGFAAAQDVPPVVRFSGSLAGGAQTVSVVFSLYADEGGQSPLWQETQTVTTDAAGRYTVHLGATRPEGLPAALFASGEARWLGVRVAGQAELPRVLLTSVPYALKAADATTIGGRPLSAFVLAGDRTGVAEDGLTYIDRRVLAQALGGSFAAAPAAGSVPTAGTAGRIAVFTDGVNLGDSALFQSGTSIGLGTTVPAAVLHVVSPTAPAAFFEIVGTLSALPAVYRAARGTPGAPTAVQTDDILGGLAVRGHDGTTFSAGQGQVMFRAAQPWTPSAHGTYLLFTTTPLDSTLWAERMRITPDGSVGIGTPTPAQRLSVAGTIESTTGGFKFPDGTTQISAGSSLGSNIFTATQTISSGNLGLPATTGSSSGVITLGGEAFIHGYGATTVPNTFLGRQAGNFSGTGDGGNVAIGYQALPASTSGRYNTAVGYGTLRANTTGGMNTAIGTTALYRNTSGLYNIGIGYAALGYVSTGGNNTAVGSYALGNNTADSNSAFGFKALYAVTTGSGNSAFGYQSLAASTANYNSAFGYNALSLNTTGAGNQAFGYYALAANTTASYNSAFGYNALGANTGSSNSAFGFNALSLNTSGQWNSAFGYQSALKTTIATGNSSFGVNALYETTTGSNNSAFGFRALLSTVGGASNTAHGVSALYDVTEGSNNTAVGALAGTKVTTGSNNTFVGALAATDAAHADIYNATAIGANAFVAQSNSMVLGGTGANAVNVGIGTSAPNTTLQVVGDIRVGTAESNGCLMNFAGTAIAGTCSSDARLKRHVRPFGDVLDKVTRLRPVRFDWRVEEFPQYHFGAATNAGLIAQEVEQLFPEMVSTDERGYKMVNYSELPYLTLAAVGELRAENDALRARVAELERLQRQILEALAKRHDR